MIYDFLKEIEEAAVRDISLYAEPVRYDPVEIDLVDMKTDKVIGDTYQRLAFKRVMKNRDNRLYANKIDYMMDTNDASDVFSGHNKYQTILFIFCNHINNMSFWKIFRPKLTFSENISYSKQNYSQY